MKQLTVSLPEYLASALINGDTSSLESPEAFAILEAAIAYCSPGRIVSCEGSRYFSWNPELPEALPGMMLDFVVCYPG